MNKKPDIKLGDNAQPCPGSLADYLRSWPVDCSRQFIHVIKPGEITFAGQGGVHINETDETGIWGLRRISLAYPRGAGGAPSSRARVRDEAMRRLYKGQYPTTLKEFRKQLSEWLAELQEYHLEKVPQMTPPVVERHIRDLWNAFHSCRRDCHPKPWR